MHSKKEIAIRMRKDGRTYSEILKVVHVAKSTLSVWLREVGLAERHIRTISQKKLEGAKRGALARKNVADEERAGIYQRFRKMVGRVTDRELTLIAASLYWAEGAKEKAYKPGSMFMFANTDPRMLRMILKWLTGIRKVPIAEISFAINIHQSFSENVEGIRLYWSRQLGVPASKFAAVHYKTHENKPNKRFNPSLYKGLIRVTVQKSSRIVRELEGYIQGMSEDVQ